MSTELAWAAGFFDGEGSFGVYEYAPRKHIRLTLAQVDRRPLERFREAVGGVGKIDGPYSYPKTKVIFNWRANNRADAAYVLELIWPFMSEPKRERIAEIVEQCDLGDIFPFTLSEVHPHLADIPSRR